MCFILELSILMYNITNFGKSSMRASSYCEDSYKWKWSVHVYQAKWTYLPSQVDMLTKPITSEKFEVVWTSFVSLYIEMTL